MMISMMQIDDDDNHYSRPSLSAHPYIDSKLSGSGVEYIVLVMMLVLVPYPQQIDLLLINT